MDKEKIQEIFRIFMANSSGAWDSDKEIDCIKSLAYRDGAIDFCSTLLREMENE